MQQWDHFLCVLFVETIIMISMLIIFFLHSPQVLVSVQYSVHSSLAMPGIHLLNNNCSHMLSWVLPCQKLWVFSVLWWPSCCYSLSKKCASGESVCYNSTIKNKLKIKKYVVLKLSLLKTKKKQYICESKNECILLPFACEL